MTVFEKTEIEAFPVIEITPTVRSVRIVKYFVFITVVHATFVVSIFPPLQSERNLGARVINASMSIC